MAVLTHTDSPPKENIRLRLSRVFAGKRKISDFVIGLGTVIFAFGVWELLSRAEILSPKTMPAASTVVERWFNLLVESEFWTDVWNTLSAALIGLALVIVIGSIAAVMIGLIPFVRESTYMVVEFVKPIPPIALIPLGLLLWGPSSTMKITLITLGAIWPFLTQMVYGIRQTNNVAMDMSKSYRLGWWLTTSRIVFPTLSPYALTGLRISASIAVIVSVTTELIGGTSGLGQTIVIAQINSDLATMYAYILSAGFLGVLINLVFYWLEKPLLFWHESQRGETS